MKITHCNHDDDAVLCADCVGKNRLVYLQAEVERLRDKEAVLEQVTKERDLARTELANAELRALCLEAAEWVKSYNLGSGDKLFDRLMAAGRGEGKGNA